MVGLLFIDGLPGSGKSSLARALGAGMPESRVFLETNGPNPFHIVPTDDLGAAFESINTFSPELIAHKSLTLWGEFASEAMEDRYIVESYPFQSGSRLLHQVDADRATVMGYLRRLLDLVQPLSPRLILLEHHDVRMSMDRICEIRGPAWASYIDQFVERTPWALNRSLKGRDASVGFLTEIMESANAFLETAGIDHIRLPGGPEFGDQTIEAAKAWLQ
jgi:hypothetical protein